MNNFIKLRYQLVHYDSYFNTIKWLTKKFITIPLSFIGIWDASKFVGTSMLFPALTGGIGGGGGAPGCKGIWGPCGWCGKCTCCCLMRILYKWLNYHQ